MPHCLHCCESAPVGCPESPLLRHNFAVTLLVSSPSVILEAAEDPIAIAHRSLEAASKSHLQRGGASATR